MMATTFQKLGAELIGTFCVVFAGTGAIIVDDLYGNVTHVGIAITFGLIVLAMIYAVGDISGSHLNPAVTLGFFFAKRFDGQLVVPFILSQCSGAILASGLLRVIFPASVSLGGTNPTGSPWQSFILECVLSFILMFVILNVSTGSKEKGLLAGVAIGAVITLEAMFAGPVSGASMNPARSLGPALIAWQTTNLQIYVTAPIVGAFVGVCTHRVVYGTSYSPNSRDQKNNP